MKRILGIFFGLGCLGSLNAAPARAFIFLGFSEFPNPGTRPVDRAPYWAPRTVTFKINSDQSIYGGSLTPELTSAEYVASVTRGISAWNQLCGSDLQVVLDTSDTTNIKNGSDGVNTLSWDNRTAGEGNALSTSTLGVAYSSIYTSNPGTDQYADCDIVINGNSTGDLGVGGEFAKYDLTSVLVHELGHCLGLDHAIVPGSYTSNNPIVSNAPMAALLTNGDTSKRTLSQDELDAMECVYPSGKSIRAGTRCSSFHGTTNPAGLSGVVSGGPSVTSACSAAAAAITAPAKRKSGFGCITSAVGDDFSKTSSDESGFFQIIGQIIGKLGPVFAAWFLVIGSQLIQRRANSRRSSL